MSKPMVLSRKQIESGEFTVELNSVTSSQPELRGNYTFTIPPCKDAPEKTCCVYLDRDGVRTHEHWPMGDFRIG